MDLARDPQVQEKSWSVTSLKLPIYPYKQIILYNFKLYDFMGPQARNNQFLVIKLYETKRWSVLCTDSQSSYERRKGETRDRGFETPEIDEAEGKPD